MRKFLSAAVLALIPALANAGWGISNEESIVSFVSIKDHDIAETHYFKYLTGGLEDDGNFEIGIDLASLESRIMVREMVLKKEFFRVQDHPNATLRGRVRPDVLDGLEPGQTRRAVVPATLTLSGESKEYSLNLLVTRLAEDRIQVSSRFPLILYIEDYGMAANKEAVRRYARIKSISDAVPVSYILVFQRD